MASVQRSQVVLDRVKQVRRRHAEPTGKVGERGERRQAAAVLDGADEGAREGPAKLRLGHPTCTAATADLRAQSEGCYMAMFSNS